MTGKIVKYDKNRMFGFIKPLDNGPDVFFHAKCVYYSPIEVHDKVSFETSPSKNKPGSLNAVHVQIIEEE